MSTSSQLEECVGESEKTKRAREKLKKRLGLLEKQITKEALNKKIIEIHDRISRHAPSRVVLKRKTISLFDNNQNSAEVSNKVSEVYKKVQNYSKMFFGTVNFDKKPESN